MNCPACGREYDPTIPTCPYCQKANPFQILPPETGAAGSMQTAPEAHSPAAESDPTTRPQPRVLFRQINLGSLPGSPLVHLVGGLILGLLALALLPLLLIVGVIWATSLKSRSR